MTGETAKSSTRKVTGEFVDDPADDVTETFLLDGPADPEAVEVEPGQTRRGLAAEVFGRDISDQVPPEPESPFARMYTRNMTTRHADLLGGTDGYLLTEEAELAGLRRFANELQQERH